MDAGAPHAPAFESGLPVNPNTSVRNREGVESHISTTGPSFTNCNFHRFSIHTMGVEFEQTKHVGNAQIEARRGV